MKTIAQAYLCAAAAAVALFANPLRAAAQVGTTAPDFQLTDLNGQPHKLSEYKGKIVVLEWTNPGCPIVGKHYRSHNMQDTQKVAAEMGVVWLTINSGRASAPGDLEREEAAAWQKKMGAITTAYLRDQDGKVGHLYGATATPNMYVINAEGVLVYKGAIDSIPSADADDIPRATNYVKAALNALKEGKPVEKSATQAYGCAIKYARPGA